MPHILSIVTFLPLLGAAAILVARLLNKGGQDAAAPAARWIALVTTILVLAVSVVLVAQFDPSNPAYQFVENHAWFAGAAYHLGVDGISILFVLLTAFLLPICIVASWKSIQTRVVEYMIAFLILETLVIGVFTSLDLFLFYIFFEGTLVPMYLIIGIWGGANRIYAAYKFFLYTLLGSVLM
ncbi:proton-conducting transporter transmembrane domain-containing protein, partial [Brevundimonas naejangsanensis]